MLEYRLKKHVGMFLMEIWETIIYKSGMSKTITTGLCILLTDIIINYHRPW